MEGVGRGVGDRVEGNSAGILWMQEGVRHNSPPWRELQGGQHPGDGGAGSHSERVPEHSEKGHLEHFLVTS